MTDNEKIFDAFAATCKERDFSAVLIIDDGDRYLSMQNGSYLDVFNMLKQAVEGHAQHNDTSPTAILIHMAVSCAMKETNFKTSDAFNLLTDYLAKSYKEAEKTWGNQS